MTYAPTQAAFGARLLHVQDQKPSGTDGGDFNAGAWRTRDLNTIVTNEIGASLGGNLITLLQGEYYIEASAPAALCGHHMARLFDSTSASVLLSGTSAYTLSTVNGVSRSFLSGRFSSGGGPIDLFLEHRCEVTRANDGFGFATGDAFTVAHETYSDVKIWQLSAVN